MLKRVSIQNFKSLKDVTLDLQKINLLIGPNNSGKTNFLKALEFFASYNSSNMHVDKLQLVSYKHQILDMAGLFEFMPDKNGFMATKHNGDGYDIYHYQQTYKVDTSTLIPNVEILMNDWFTANDGTVTNGEVMGGHRQEFDNFARTHTFKPDPAKLLQYAKLSVSDITLNPDCSNLIAFYYFLDTNFKRKNAQAIQDDLNRCIPEFAYFTLPPVKIGNESMLGLRFFDKDDIGYWADEVSEGVLYFIALLCIVHQPNPPKFLLIEEPEKGIHPRRIEEIINFILGLADEKNIQVIMTTHSPIVVDMFKDMPESVFIFDKDDDGATHVKNLQKDIIEPETEESKRLSLDPPHYLNGLGQAWKVGLIGGVPR